MQYTNIIWRNGQPYSEMFDDIYYSSDEGEDISGEHEFDHVFFKNNGLPERWHENKDFVIAELGFGSGLNCLLTIRAWLKHLAESKQRKCLHYIAIEKHPLAPQTIVELISRYPELKQYCDELVDNYPPAIESSHSRRLFDGKVIVHYKLMDAVVALKGERFNVDAWYLDGFSPANNPAMWSQELFLLLAQNSNKDARCSTYTSAGFVKRNLISAGFEVSKVAGYGRKREMLIASYKQQEKKLYSYSDKPWFALPAKADASEKTATVIGAGIAGLCAAYSLIKRGWHVTVIDRHEEIAKEASSNPVALVYPRLSIDNPVDTDFYLSAYSYALHNLNFLQEKYQEEFWFDTGLLQSFDKKRITAIVKKYQFNDDLMSVVGTVKNASGENAEHQISVDIKNAGVVIPALLCEIIRRECSDKLNFKIAEIEQIKNTDNGWQCFDDSKLVANSEILIVANGTSLNNLNGFLPYPVEKVRGQVIAVQANSSSSDIRQAINADVYLTPLIQERHYLGATYNRNSDNTTLDDGDTKKLLSKLASSSSHLCSKDLFTKVDDARSWVGFRSMSKDRVPIVGAVPDADFYTEEYEDICHGNIVKDYRAAQYLKGLYVTAAHGSRGFTSGFLAAEIIAAQIQGEPLPVSKEVVDYLSPSRFIVNDLKRR